MVYVMSDLHGEYEAYLAMLEKISFGARDTLYLLGDHVDRGEGGVRILLDLMRRKNVVPLLGNHDWAMLTLLKNREELAKKQGRNNVAFLLRLWFEDGGRETCRAFLAESEETQKKLLDFLEDMDFIAQITVNGKQYFLSHTLPPYCEDVLLTEQPADNFIHGETDYDKQYFSDTVTVTGHQPTELIDRAYRGKIWKGNNHIAIDCGAFYTGSLGCICLDTMEEFYVKEK